MGDNVLHLNLSFELHLFWNLINTQISFKPSLETKLRPNKLWI